MVNTITEIDLKEYFDVMIKSYKAAAVKAGFSDRGRANFNFDELLKQYNNGNMLYASRVDGKIVGILTLKMRSNGTCKIQDIAVLPEYQRHGFGKELIGYAKHKAKELNAKKIELGMFDDNINLGLWYEKNGFTTTGTVIYDSSPFVIRYMEFIVQA